MMVIIKQKFIKINFIILLTFFSSCSKANDSLFECLLNSFIDYYEVNSDKYVVYVSETQGWTEDSSILIFRKEKESDFKIFSDERLKVTNFKGIKVYRLVSSFDSIPILKDNIVSDNLIWSTPNKKSMNSNDSEIPIIYDPPKVQLIYNYKTKTINSEFNSKKDFKNAVISDCNGK